MQAISIDVDRSEYCRYRPDLGMDKVTANLVFTSAGAGDVVTVNLVRMDGFGALPGLQQTVTTTAGQPSARVTFTLASALEPLGTPAGAGQQEIYRAVQGDYQVQATATGMAGTAASATFAVTIVPTDELRQQWLKGVVLQARDVLMPFQQPQVLTGVTIKRISEGTTVGVHTLAFTPGSPGTLSFDGGTAVNVPALRGDVALVSADGMSYAVCTVVPFLLPAGAATESLVIEEDAFSDAALRNYVRQATGALESEFYFPVEPRTFDTDPTTSPATYGYFVDQFVEPVTYRRPRDFAHWMGMSLQTRRVIKLYRLGGFFNSSQAVNIPIDWLTKNGISGGTELVPSNGAVISWQFFGAAILQFFLNFDTIPGFWHFGYAAGLPSLDGEYGIVRQAVARAAAVDILGAAGYALTGGAGSISTGRDGVSDSRSYGARPGDALLKDYQGWLDKNIRRLRTRYGGIPVGFI